MLLISLLPMAAVVLYNESESTQMMERAEIDALKLLAIGKARALDQLLEDVLNDAALVANNEEVQRFLRTPSPTNLPTINHFLENIKTLSPTYNQVILLNREGRSVSGTKEARLGLDYSSTFVWQRGMETDHFISYVKIKSAIADEPVFIVFQKILDRDNQLLGAVLFPMRATAIKDILTYLVPDIHGQSFLVDNHGLILSGTNPDIDLHSIDALPLEIRKHYFLLVPPEPIPSLSDHRRFRLRNVIFKSKAPGAFLYSRTGKSRPDYIYAYAPLAIHQAAVVVSVSLKEFLTPLERLVMHSLVSLLFVGGGVMVISLVVARSITKPIRAIVTAALALKNDQFEAEILQPYVRGKDDMGELAQVFLEMAQAVKQRQDELREQLSELKIEIDQEKRKKMVTEITSTDYFQSLRQRAQQLRQRPHPSPPATEAQIGHTEGEASQNQPKRLP